MMGKKMNAEVADERTVVDFELAKYCHVPSIRSSQKDKRG